MQTTVMIAAHSDACTPAWMDDSPRDGPMLLVYSSRGFICRLPERMIVR